MSLRTTRNKVLSLVVAAGLISSSVSCGGPGALGLQDYQRDLLFGLFGGLANALLLQVAGNANDAAQTAPPVPGARGPDLFSVYVERFFEADVDDALNVTPVRVDVAVLREGEGPIGYRAAIPLTYAINGVKRPITMRMIFVRSGPCDGSCTSLAIDTRCLEAGASAPICFGGDASDCSDGRRFIQLSQVCESGEDVQRFLSVDLPLGAGGLDLPELNAGDFLAFELRAISTDGGAYRLIGVEIFDSAESLRVNVDVFRDEADLPPDCAAMGQPDFDGDGVADVDDADDDGDGIPDVDEGDEDTDGDSHPDSLDIDSDNDGIVDAVEAQPSGDGFIAPSGMDADGDGLDDAYDPDQGGTPIVPIDTDDDGVPDVLDSDTDNDLVPDSTEGHDANMDGIPDTIPTSSDVDEDGLFDEYDTVVRPAAGNALGSNAPLQDTDGDGTPDWRDTDDDGDGTPTRNEDRNGNGDPTDDDTDGDGTPDYLDPDGDFDGDGVPDPDDEDDDGDGVPDDKEDEGDPDPDGDGQPNSLDIDSDNDGIVDAIEAQPRGAGFRPPSGVDADGDGLDDAYDPDQGGTPITPVDTDQNGTPDMRDLDTDNDLVPDATEGHDANIDGQPDVTPSGNDADMDGLDDVYDTIVRPAAGNALGSNAPLQDTDGDGTPDWRDTDDDGDGTPTRDEDRNGNGDPTDDDNDGDATPDYLDPDGDFDGDGVPDPDDEDDDGDGVPDDEEDQGDPDPDGDGQPNSLDIDSDNDGIVDAVEAQPRGEGFRPPSGVDADGDGLDDAYEPDQGGTPIMPVDTDDDGTPDMRDLDADNDTVPDATEGHDANMDGQPDVTPSGNDADEDGLDDVYDTVVRPAAGNALGGNAPLQDTDDDGTPDWRDMDDDGDGIPTIDEDVNENGDPTDDDSDNDGTPDYLDPDNDCNDNDIPDHLDIENGTSQDCNGNGRPDECDIEDEESEDTNENGVPDECEIPGACCFPDDTCLEIPLVRCKKAGGRFLGVGTECIFDPQSEEETGFCPDSVGACCMPDNSCVELPEPMCDALEGEFLGAGTECSEPTDSLTDTGRYLLRNGRGFAGGMIVFNFLWTSGATWFDFDADGAGMFLDYDDQARTIHVFGLAKANFGGQDGFAVIDVFYENVVEDGGGLKVFEPADNTGTIIWLPTNQTQTLFDKANSSSFTFRLFDKGSWDKGEGWFTTDDGSADFHFEASRESFCDPDPIGACCLEDSCVIVTESTCDDLGGGYEGDGSDCADCLPDCDDDIFAGFENGTDWTCVNMTNCGIEVGMGNPGNSFGGCDAQGESSVIAGADFTGDLLAHNGGTFSLDLLFFDDDTVEDRLGQVHITTSEGTFVQDIIPVFEPVPFVYSNFSGEFTAQAFGVDEGTWQAGLRNVTRIRIVIEPRWGCWCIDNVRLGCPD